jgi:hypothetical protein
MPEHQGHNEGKYKHFEDISIFCFKKCFIQLVLQTGNMLETGQTACSVENINH